MHCRCRSVLEPCELRLVMLGDIFLRCFPTVVLALSVDEDRGCGAHHGILPNRSMWHEAPNGNVLTPCEEHTNR